MLQNQQQTNFQQQTIDTGVTIVKSISPLNFILIPLMFFSWFFGLTTLAIYIPQQIFINNSTKSVGIITKKDFIYSCSIESRNTRTSGSTVTTRNESCGNKYSIKYAYEVGKNNFEGYSSVDENSYITISTGDKITIFFSNNDPSTSQTQFNTDTEGVIKYFPIVGLSVAAISTYLYLKIGNKKRKSNNSSPKNIA